MKNKNKQIFIFFGMLLAVLLMFLLIKNNSEDIIDPDITNQNVSVTFNEPIMTEGSEETTAEFKSSDSENTETTEGELAVSEERSETDDTHYAFRSSKLLNQHYQKHGIDMGFSSAEEYEEAAEAVVKNSNALHKIEAEDGDDIYYLEETNEFVVVSTDGYIRTYFNPDKGIDYYNRQ